MRLDEVRQLPTTLDRVALTREYMGQDSSFLYWLPTAPLGWHESLLRSYHIVRKVKELLEQGTPPAVVLELIELMEAPTP